MIMTMGTDPTEDDSEMMSRRHLLAGMGGIGLTTLAGCLVRGFDDHGLRGEIRIDGSNTVLPHAAAVAEEFQWRNNRVRIPVRGSGTGAGFQRFCQNETDFQNASRRIADDELEICESNGVEYLALEVALDGIAVFAHPDNDWCDCLTVEELGEIWRSGSDVETWQDIREEWDDEPLDLYGRDPASGTFDFFTEALTGEVGNIRSDYSASSDTNVIVRGVRGSRYGLGFGGAGYYYENEDDLKLIGVDDGDGCVEPGPDTVESGAYTPLTRPLFLYLNTGALADEASRRFAQFYFEEIDDRIPETEFDPQETRTYTQWAARRVGYYGVPEETIEENVEQLEAAIAEVTE